MAEMGEREGGRARGGRWGVGEGDASGSNTHRLLRFDSLLRSQGIVPVRLFS